MTTKNAIVTGLMIGLLGCQAAGPEEPEGIELVQQGLWSGGAGAIESCAQRQTWPNYFPRNGDLLIYKDTSYSGQFGCYRIYTTDASAIIWSDLTALTWPDGSNVHDGIGSFYAKSRHNGDVQKVSMCQHAGCETYGIPGNIVDYEHTWGSGVANSGAGTWGISAFVLQNDY